MAAGVSLSTASRALSRPEMVSDDVRRSIERVCKEVRYIPSHAARTLSRDRTDVVGVIVPTIENPLFAPTIDALRSSLDEMGRALLMNSCDRDPIREYEQCRSFVERGVEAIVLMNAVHDPRLLEMLDDVSVPYVCLGTPLDGTAAPTVTFDNGQAMALAIDHVLALGHGDVAVLSGHRSTSPVIGARIDGAVRALAEAGARPPDEWVVESGYDGISARQGAHRLVTGRRKPTAIVCTGDMHALAAIIECRALGLDVPADVSVTGCNDMPVALFCDPQLTTIRTPYRKLGSLAAEQIARLLDGTEISDLVLCDVELIERDSVAIPRRRRGTDAAAGRKLPELQFRGHEF